MPLLHISLRAGTPETYRLATGPLRRPRHRADCRSDRCRGSGRAVPEKRPPKAQIARVPSSASMILISKRMRRPPSNSPRLLEET